VIYLAALILGSSVWVAFDAANLGARTGVRPGKPFDVGPGFWFFDCLIFWIIAFPMYLAARPDYVAAKRRREAA
jgi:hypothetical protein